MISQQFSKDFARILLFIRVLAGPKQTRMLGREMSLCLLLHLTFNFY